MAQSPQEESRTSALGRKRKQWSDYVTSTSFKCEDADKRQKLDSIADFVALDDGVAYIGSRRGSNVSGVTRESGEISTSAEESRQVTNDESEISLSGDGNGRGERATAERVSNTPASQATLTIATPEEAAQRIFVPTSPFATQRYKQMIGEGRLVLFTIERSNVQTASMRLMQLAFAAAVAGEESNDIEWVLSPRWEGKSSQARLNFSIPTSRAHALLLYRRKRFAHTAAPRLEATFNEASRVDGRLRVSTSVLTPVSPYTPRIDSWSSAEPANIRAICQHYSKLALLRPPRARADAREDSASLGFVSGTCANLDNNRLAFIAETLASIPHSITVDDVKDVTLRSEMHAAMKRTASGDVAHTRLSIADDDVNGRQARQLLFDKFQQIGTGGTNHSNTVARNGSPVTDPIIPKSNDATALGKCAVLALSDIHPKPFQEFVRKQSLKRRGSSIEAIVRGLCVPGESYYKQATKLLKKWRKEHDTEALSAGPLDGNLDVPLTLDPSSQIFKTLSHSIRRMRAADTPRLGNPRSQATGNSKRSPNESYDEVLLEFAADGGKPSALARQALETYVKTNYSRVRTAVGSDGRFFRDNMTSGEALSVLVALQKDVGRSEPEQKAVDPIPVGQDTIQTSRTEDEGSEMDLSSDRSDGGVSVGDVPVISQNDKTQLARDAASAGKVDSRPGAMIRLNEISDEDQALQHRYFGLNDPQTYVRCLSCGQQGHMKDGCPSRTCKHCGALDQHLASACPAFRKCNRCRQRGHDAHSCTARPVHGGELSDPCDVCGHTGHVEEECSHLWRTYFPTSCVTSKMARKLMKVACYNCGSSQHWGDDCPDLPSFVRRHVGKNMTWSKAYADRFIEGGETRISDGDDGYERAYQRAQLGSLMD